METPTAKRTRLLGEPYGTATSRLRKMLLFDFAYRLGLDLCYRCEKPIETLEEFSIEHTIAWQGAENPKETFFDLDTIAFSHLKCNVAAGSYPHKKWVDKREGWREASRRRYADPIRYEKHLERKRK